MNLKSYALAVIVLPAGLYAQVAEDSALHKLSGSVSAYYYFIHGQEKYPAITVCTDYKSLHFETRYNYEDKNTASAFAGYTFEKDGKFTLCVTPMAGIAVGNTNGILPGLECSASYSKINFYSENEYMLDFKGKENNFFYSWTQLSADVSKNLKAGVLAQSLRWYKTKFDVQRGICSEYALGNFTIGAYYFNPFTQYDFVVASLCFEF